jgi:GrpB-like predicted nucleotidyltransferase (UPF0157 family)
MPEVEILPYSDAWPEHFRVVRDELLSACSPTPVLVEHTGSTSVPGLAAKSVIDVLLGVHALRDVESRMTSLGSLGYNYVQKYERELPMRRYFVRAAAAIPRVHVHAVEIASDFWREQLAFRDLLRSDSTVRAEYQALKLQLAVQFADDKAAYTAAKGPFVQAALAGTLRLRTAVGATGAHDAA